MREDREHKPNVIGLFIILGAVILIAVGAFGLLSRSGTTQTSAAPLVAQPTVVSSAPTSQSAPIIESGGQSAVARGGSRSKPTTNPTPAVNLPKQNTNAVEIMLPGEQAPTANALGVSSANSPFRIEVLSAAYDVSGQPSKGCSVFDNRVPARRFTLTLNVINESGEDYAAGAWGAAAYIGNARATLCLAGNNGLPSFASGTRQQITFIAFAHSDQAITAINIGTATGLNAKVCFSEERVVSCPE